MSDVEFRSEFDMFANKTTRGAALVNVVLVRIRGLPHAVVLLLLEGDWA